MTKKPRKPVEWGFDGDSASEGRGDADPATPAGRRPPLGGAVRGRSMSAPGFETWFKDATGFGPYGWQMRVAMEGLPEVLPVPTGLGKTEGAVLAWAWRRLHGDRDEPMHLVYCLPMRVLVRQTAERLERCFEKLSSKRGQPRVPVYQLMGGSIDDKWARLPDQPWILVGTQDQLLSRALNRGYAMSRFEWPVHFGLLNQDCRWIVDEVQLMGPGLWTTSQLDWMRRKRFPGLKPCLTTWMSATVGMGFLETTDRKHDGLDTGVAFDPELAKDNNAELKKRLNARRRVEWLRLPTGKQAAALDKHVASRVHDEHVAGTLSLVVCNTVKTAQDIFRALPDRTPKILLTSRFRPADRRAAEKLLLDFESRRVSAHGWRLDGDAGLVCVSTQVVEAGLDISAHRLWSEIAPWPSVIQRLGRLNRDGRDDGACASFWRTPKDQEERRDVGPYEKQAIDRSAELLDALMPASSLVAAITALDALGKGKLKKTLRDALQPAPAPLPRALDVHGLFSTERDVHGGFTDVSAFVRNSDPDADVTVFWRAWPPERSPARGDALVGPSFDPKEGCQVPFYRLRDTLQARHAKAWTWNDEEERWERCSPAELRSGMLVMLHRDVGGYDGRLGWTGKLEDVLSDQVEPPGPGRALLDDRRTETGYWARLDVHLADARREAERICDGLNLNGLVRSAIIEAAALHDLGKAHPKWNAALPGYDVLSGGPWAKCPRVLAVDARSEEPELREAVARLRPRALQVASEARRPQRLRLRWALDQPLGRDELEGLRKVRGVLWAGHVSFRPGMRHEAASALAMWRHYREQGAPYPALSVYLAAAHHGKVRTVVRATTPAGDDVFGVTRQPNALELDGKAWPLDFGVAADGAAGDWGEREFVVSDHGWTGLVADLLGPWQNKEEDKS